MSNTRPAYIQDRRSNDYVEMQCNDSYAAMVVQEHTTEAEREAFREEWNTTRQPAICSQ